MEVTAIARPTSHARPTQAYYVPRKKLECQGGRQTSPEEPTSRVERKPSAPSVVAEQRTPLATSPKTNASNGRSSPQSKTERKGRGSPQKPPKTSPKASPRFEPRPLMSELLPKPEMLKEKSPKQLKPLPLTVSEPRLVQPSTPSPSGPPARPNAFSPSPDGEKDVCICFRPDAFICCRRCGHEIVGRVARVCQMHPMKMNLMDIRECPNRICRSIQIFETDLDVPKVTDQSSE